MAKNNFPIRVARMIDEIPERIFADAITLAAAIGIPAADVLAGYLDYTEDKCSNVVEMTPIVTICPTQDIVPDTIPMRPKPDTQLEPINEPMYFNIA